MLVLLSRSDSAMCPWKRHGVKSQAPYLSVIVHRADWLTFGICILWHIQVVLVKNLGSISYNLTETIKSVHSTNVVSWKKEHSCGPRPGFHLHLYDIMKHPGWINFLLMCFRCVKNEPLENTCARSFKWHTLWFISSSTWHQMAHLCQIKMTL